MLLALLAFPAYETVEIEGWKIHVEQPLIQGQASKWGQVKRELESQFYQIGRAVPAPALAKLRRVPIWIHLTSPETKCAAYHPGAQWLTEHKMNPAMAKGFEIGNADNFIAWTHQQPWMVLHELAHAYHDQFLPQGFDNPDLKAAYEAAKASKKYEKALVWSGERISHYGMNNPMEFFAEASEAYFGQNDFFPFVRAELRDYDPATFALVERLWKE